MQELLSLYSNIANPTFEMVLFTFLLAFLLAVMIAVTYTKTTPSTFKSTNLTQAMILSSLIAATVVQSTNSSLSSGVGLLGALTIIQFRSTFRDPRDVIFMFAAVSSGISCGSFVFLPAIIGSLSFCFIAFMLRFTPYNIGNHLIYELRVRFNPENDRVLFVEKVLNQYCTKWTIESLKNDSTKDEQVYQELDYTLLLRNDEEYKKFIADLEKEGIAVRKFNKQNSDFTSNN
jgi:uncharacterized membrane protein YhiD involved in acid resistance